LAHHPYINIPAISEGFPAGDNAVGTEEIDRIIDMVCPYVIRVERCIDISDFMPTGVPPGDEASPPAERNFERMTPFAVAAAGHLSAITTCPGGANNAEASSSRPKDLV
jgi:hypothetical protein